MRSRHVPLDSKRIDNLQLFNNRARPSVRNNERQSIFMFRTNVNEMNVQPINIRDELWQGLQFRFDLAPIVICNPIARERLNEGELYALRIIRDRFPFREPCRVYTPAQFNKFRFRYIHIKRTNIHVTASRCCTCYSSISCICCIYSLR